MNGKKIGILGTLIVLAGLLSSCGESEAVQAAKKYQYEDGNGKVHDVFISDAIKTWEDTKWEILEEAEKYIIVGVTGNAPVPERFAENFPKETISKTSKDGVNLYPMGLQFVFDKNKKLVGPHAITFSGEKIPGLGWNFGVGYWVSEYEEAKYKAETLAKGEEYIPYEQRKMLEAKKANFENAIGYYTSYWPDLAINGKPYNVDGEILKAIVESGVNASQPMLDRAMEQILRYFEESSSVQYLITKGATPSYGVLVKAAEFADVDAIKSIYEKNPVSLETRASDYSGLTPMEASLKNKNHGKDLVSFFESKGAKIPSYALQIVEDMTLIPFLLEKGIDPKAFDRRYSPLISRLVESAVSSVDEPDQYTSYMGAIKALVIKGAVIEYDTMTRVFEFGKLDVLKELINLGGPLEGEDLYQTPLKDRILNSNAPGINEIITLMEARK